jgi:hypothetical protein
MKTRPSDRSASTRGRRGFIVFVGALALLSGVLSSCGSKTGSSAAGPPSSTSVVSPSVTQISPTSTATRASWRRIATPPFSGDPEDLTTVWDGTEMLVVHFTASPGAERCHEDAAAYDPATDTWRTLPAVPRPRPMACYNGSGDQAVWTGREMLLWGLTNTAYSPASNRWRRLSHAPDGWDLPPAPAVVVWTGRQMIGWGGVDCCGIASTRGMTYTPRSNSWKRLPPTPLSGGGGPAGVWTGKELLIAGGDDGEGQHIFAEAAAYQPATRTWRTLPPMPISRDGGTALWDGKEVLIFGGWGGANETYGPTRLLARGVAYDPSANRWRWLAAPEFPRDGAVYAWDGHEVLMWGGRGLDGSVPPHGEAFDPATNTWSALPKAPLRGRVEANSVWTGTELIIWGGVDARTAKPDGTWRGLTDGAAFKPASR